MLKSNFKSIQYLKSHGDVRNLEVYFFGNLTLTQKIIKINARLNAENHDYKTKSELY